MCKPAYYLTLEQVMANHLGRNLQLAFDGPSTIDAAKNMYERLANRRYDDGSAMCPGLQIVHHGDGGYNLTFLPELDTPAILVTHSTHGWQRYIGANRAAAIDALRQQLAFDGPAARHWIEWGMKLRLQCFPSYEVSLTRRPSSSGQVFCLVSDLRDRMEVEFRGDGTREQAINIFLHYAARSGEHWLPLP